MTDDSDEDTTGKIDINIDLEKPSSESLDKPVEELTADDLARVGIEIDTEEFPDEWLDMPPEEFLESHRLTLGFEHEHEWDDPPDDRVRGFLTETDRRFLRGKSEIEPHSHSERKARERIRNRIFNAFLDFSLVFRFFEERDREQIFSNPNRSPGKELALWNGAIHTLSFLYERLRDEEDYDLKYTLDAAVLAVEEGPGSIIFEPPDITFDVDASGVVDLGTIGEKLKAGRVDLLTANELDAAEFAINRDAEGEKGPDPHTREQVLRTIEGIREEFIESSEDEDEDTD
jgi:hypothetical protein